jgi:hypothetical protein
MIDKKEIIHKCRILIDAYRSHKLGQTRMPEDSSPIFGDKEQESCLAYFTLPMSLNYQRDSYKLWESALKTYQDAETKIVFNIEKSSSMPEQNLRQLLLKHKIALQPNKHVNTWQKIAQTIYKNWGTMGSLLKFADYDFMKLRDIIQIRYKKGFPYLSGPKIFNYWSFIIQRYGNIQLKNSQFIEIAPDTHITKCSVLLGVITQEEADRLSKEEVSTRWRMVLSGTDINPIDMHPPLWFWSRNGFLFNFPEKQ